MAPSAVKPGMRLALFDFDGTLTTGDSLLPFLRQVVGPVRYAAGMALMSPVLAAYAIKLVRNDVAKQLLLGHLIGGLPHADLEASGQRFAAEGIERMLRPHMMARLTRHRDQGDLCVLVSASLDVYLKPWARARGFDEVLCSSLGVDAEGRVTGRLDGGNCFGPAKRERIDAWLGGRRPGHIVAYGDSRGDREMLALANEAYLLRRGEPQQLPR